MLFGTETFEYEILTAVHNAVQSDFMDSLMVGISAVGNGGAIWIVAALVMLATKKYRKAGLVLAVGLMAGLVFGNVILKNLIARPRPCWIFEDIQMLIAVPRDYSFPSGHTLASFTSAFILLAADKRLGIPAVVIAALMAFSRMYLFVHFPTDILGGIVLSLIIFIILKRFIKKNALD